MNPNIEYPSSVEESLPIVTAVRAVVDGVDLVDTLEQIADDVAALSEALLAVVYLWSDSRLHLVGQSDMYVPSGGLSRLLASTEEHFIQSCSSGQISTGWLPQAGNAAACEVAAVPLAFRGQVLGALGLVVDGGVGADHLARMRVFADVAAVVIANGDPAPDGLARWRTLRAAIEGRIVVDQATGMLIERLGFDARAARERLRSAASDLGTGLVEVARQVVDRSINPDVATLLGSPDKSQSEEPRS